MRSLVLAGFALTSALAALACSDGAKTPASTTDDAGEGAADASTGATEPDPSAGTCSSLAQAGASVDIVGAPPPAPEAAGGTPADGAYVLKSVKAFTTLIADGATFRRFGAYTLVVGGGATTFEQVVTNEKDELKRAKGTLTAEGTSFTATPTCEDPLPEAGVTILEGTYTVEGDALKMYVVRELGITAELLFEKQ